MARAKGDWSSKSYEETRERTRREERGSATHHAEQRAKSGQGLNRLVDPKEFNGMRESFNLMVAQEDGTFVLTNGVAMPIETDFDTTGSMGGNIDVTFSVLPRAQELIVTSQYAILKGKYHAQFATGVVQDMSDKFPYQVTQFEPDNEIENQMKMLVPERDGGDSTEDYQLSVYSAAYRRRLSITQYGLKGYFFIAGDEIGRDFVQPRDVEKVLGNTAHALQGKIPVEEMGKEMLKLWHGFFLQINSHASTATYWTKVLGRERVIILPETEYIPEVQAVIIGLTEGILDLQSAVDFLTDVGKMAKRDAQMIVRSVSHIPLRAQAEMPNFHKIPLSGTVFQSRNDIWPMTAESVSEDSQQNVQDGDITWQL